MRQIVLIPLALMLLSTTVFAAEPVCVHSDATIGAQLHPRIGATTNNVIIVWQDAANIHWDVNLSVSRDSGASFSAPIAVNNDNSMTDQMYPDLALSPNGDAYIVWQDKRSGGDDPLGGDFDTYFSLFLNTDTSVTNNRNLNKDYSAGSQVRPRIAMNGADVVVAWQDTYRSTSEDGGIEWDIRMTTSHDLAASFSGPMIVAGTDGVFETDVDVVAIPAHYFVVTWTNWATGAMAGKLVSDESALETVAAMRAESSSEMLKPTGTFLGTDFTMVWQDSIDGQASRRNDLIINSGRYWDIYGSSLNFVDAPQPVRMNLEPTLSQFAPTACSDGVSPIVCWADDRSLSAYHIYCMGLNTQAPEMAIAPPVDGAQPLDQLYPDCAVANNTLHVTWQQEQLNGDFDIYYISMPVDDVINPAVGR